MNDVGKRIAERRKELNMTQDELAKRLGYTSRSTVYKVETGINDLTPSKLEAYAKALGTTPSYLMGWDDEPSLDDIPQSVLPLMDAAKDLEKKDIEYLIDLAKRLKGND